MAYVFTPLMLHTPTLTYGNKFLRSMIILQKLNFSFFFHHGDKYFLESGSDLYNELIERACRWTVIPLQTNAIRVINFKKMAIVFTFLSLLPISLRRFSDVHWLNVIGQSHGALAQPYLTAAGRIVCLTACQRKTGPCRYCFKFIIFQ